MHIRCPWVRTFGDDPFDVVLKPSPKTSFGSNLAFLTPEICLTTRVLPITNLTDHDGSGRNLRCWKSSPTEYGLKLYAQHTLDLWLTHPYFFCIGDISKALSLLTNYHFIYVFPNATGSVAGATGLTAVILLSVIFIATSTYASTSRQLFAFARDDGMPFSNWLTHSPIS